MSHNIENTQKNYFRTIGPFSTSFHSRSISHLKINWDTQLIVLLLFFEFVFINEYRFFSYFYHVALRAAVVSLFISIMELIKFFWLTFFMFPMSVDDPYESILTNMFMEIATELLNRGLINSFGAKIWRKNIRCSKFVKKPIIYSLEEGMC